MEPIGTSTLTPYPPLPDPRRRKATMVSLRAYALRGAREHARPQAATAKGSSTSSRHSLSSGGSRVRRPAALPRPLRRRSDPRLATLPQADHERHTPSILAALAGLLVLLIGLGGRPGTT